ncbi:MAG: SdrD B-like domain-containing protein [Thermoproteota archaeon]
MLNVEMRKHAVITLAAFMLMAVLVSNPACAYICVIDDQPTGQEQAKLGISGCVFYDSNVNGERDAGEPLLSGIVVELWVGEDRVTYTSTGSTYSFYNVWGEYTVKVVLAENWASTTPQAVTLTVEQGETAISDFGVVRIGCYGGGHTVGFWSSKNGEDQIKDYPGESPELQLLREYFNLRTRDGEWFEPKSYSELRSWLLNADAVNMAYMLSTKLAAMVLNVEAGFVDPYAEIYAPGVKEGTDFPTINDLIDAANSWLGLDGYTPSGDPNRAYQELLSRALDAANNNLNFVCPAP